MPGPSSLTDTPLAPNDPAGPLAPAPPIDADAGLEPALEPDAVLDELRAMLTEVIGPDELFGIDIELDTAFEADLEVESIEFVALAERLEARYGSRVDFVGWMASKELDEIIALTVGDVVAFIVGVPSITGARGNA